MKKILVFLIKCYKKWISPLLPSACRFEPTCSIYAMQAIERFGVIRGLLLAIWRILRCNPLCKSGYDPVPERFTFKSQVVPFDKAHCHSSDDVYEFEEIIEDTSSYELPPCECVKDTEDAVPSEQTRNQN